jgi:class 3 adenylate cyclase
VLFADLVGFTALSLKTPPSTVVRLLDAVFSEFDQLAAEHGLEKIKTIGDAYMAVAGLPLPRADHAEAAVRMAVDMLERIGQFNTRQRSALRMRIGINSGPVIAGVIGRSRFIYDLWGDTVNTASRMESQGEPGMIQITEDTARRLPASLAVDQRGPIEVKGKGPMTTFIVRKKR